MTETSGPVLTKQSATRVKNAWIPLATTCALVIGVYAYMAQSGVFELATLNAADSHYNLLVRGFRAGQLSLKKDVPPEFVKLADPYDPTASAPYWFAPHRMLDLSYYKGKLYLYFGITPALILFWPYVALTGHYLLHRDAVLIFCTLGFLVSVGLLWAVWRRYFAEVSVGVVAACGLALGLATGLPVLLSQADVYEVPISCGYMLTMLALAGIWCALHDTERRLRWLSAASVAYGLAVGARPTLLFGAVVLLIPVAQTWHEPQPRKLVGLLAATVPITLIGLGLMLYNARRFDSPFEFGMRYQLTNEPQHAQQLFRLRYLWFNFRVYFLGPARWSAHFPFVHGAAVPLLPAGYTQVRNPFGIPSNVPVVWLALAVPLAWRSWPGQSGLNLRWFVMAAALLFGISALTLGLFGGASFRYEVEFLPALLLLAVVGILAAERSLIDSPVWRYTARWGWGLLLGLSLAFSLLASIEYHAEGHFNLGGSLVIAGRNQEAAEQYARALWIKPDYAQAHNNLGNILLGTGKLEEAIGHYEQAVRIKPDYTEAHYNLAVALEQAGRVPEAVSHYEQALRLRPDLVEARNSLARLRAIQ